MDLAKIGDKVVCKCNGGPHKVVSGASTVFVDDVPAARVGDRSSCGASIVTGADWFEIEDSPAAINGSKTSCGGRVITGSSVSTGSPTSIAIGGFRFEQTAPASTDTSDEAATARSATSVSPAASDARPAMAEPAQADEDTATDGAAPGFHIVERPMSGQQLEAELLGWANSQARKRFRTLNLHLADRARPGRLAILSDPDNLQCTVQEARLSDAAARADAALATLSDEDAQFMVENYHAIAAFLGHASTGVGVPATLAGKHLTTIERTLRSIERLHQRSFAEHGNLNNPEFFAQRRRLFGQLNGAMRPLVRRGVGFPDHPSLRHALGISTRSLTHHWRDAGVGDIPGYATHIEGLAKAARYIRAGGWIGVALGGAASYAKVQEVCASGRDAECERVKYTEAGAFVGGLGGGAVGGSAAGLGAAAVCSAIGLATAGVGAIACGLVVVGAGSLIGSELGGLGGETVGNVIFEGIAND
nr:PAAR domain-containing protein [uncultured Halomonas sp.]